MVGSLYYPRNERVILMKRKIWALALITVMLTVVACVAEDKKVTEIKFDTLKAKVSYAIGLGIGRDFATQGVDADPEILSAGIKDALSGAEQRLSDEELQAAVAEFQKDLMAKREAQMKKDLTENDGKGAAFLAENGKKTGVTILESGLQYKVVAAGSGKKPSAESQVKVHYRGTLIDGTEFDSSYKRGEPVTFPVGGVIKGWTEALQLMEEGAKWELVIPAGLAYGERGAPPAIGPNAVLVFEVELLEIM
jgi:FKBP-type peptidyl-prolyl cis-trans isomerase FklB